MTEPADTEIQPDWGCMARKFSIKFGSIEISVFRDITKIHKKSTILKISRQFILHNNDSKTLLSNW